MTVRGLPLLVRARFEQVLTGKLRAWGFLPLIELCLVEGLLLSAVGGRYLLESQVELFFGLLECLLVDFK
jgi:hypothetical protein